MKNNIPSGNKIVKTLPSYGNTVRVYYCSDEVYNTYQKESQEVPLYLCGSFTTANSEGDKLC